MDKTQIKFYFQPLGVEDKAHAVEKDEGGKKRKYLYGISSGVSVDVHGERMTPECIKSLLDQSNSGDILLYPDLHGVRGTDDIGILTKAHIDEKGDWVTEYRLYDEDDGMGAQTLEKSDKMWRQVNGLPPYTKARQKGFSIEGHIPEQGIVQMSEGGKRVINKVELDGVVIVPKPAYKTSVAHAVYKALGESAPWQVQKSISNRLRAQVEAEELNDAYYRKRHSVESALNDEIESVMKNPNNSNKAEDLEIVFDEYKTFMIELILQSQSLFKCDQEQPSPEVVLTKNMSRLDLYKALYENMSALAEIKKSKKGV